MKRLWLALLILCCASTSLFAQETTPTPAVETPASAPAATIAPPASTLPEQPKPKRGLFSRILHPFSGGGDAPAAPEIANPKLRGLVLEVQVSPQTVKLSEVRQLEVKVTLTNRGKKTVTLDFPNEQRIEIVLMNSAEIALTKWSENHAFKDKPGTLLINPQEHVEYNEKITTRELKPDTVFIAEAFFPKYPELRARQKFLTAP